MTNLGILNGLTTGALSAPLSAMTLVDLGDPLALAMAVVAVSLLVVIILLMPYFNILKTIADFSYPNAMFKSVGLALLSMKNLETLGEASSIQDLAGRLEEYGFRTSSSQENNLESLEDKLELEIIRNLRNTLSSVPEAAKPFYRAYLARMDALQVKKVLRGMRSSAQPSLHPAYYVDAEKVKRLLEAVSPKDIVEILEGTPFGPALSNAMQHNPEKPVLWEAALDYTAMEGLFSSVFHVDQELQSAFREFYGRMADISNIILIARLKENLGEKAGSLMVAPGGRELPDWYIETLMDSQDVSSLIVELEGTAYGRKLKEMGLGPDATASEMERALDLYLLELVSEISSRNGLLSGPSIMFAFGKEREIANIRAVARNLVNGGSFGDVEPFLMVEVRK